MTRQTMTLKPPHRELKLEHEPNENKGWTRVCTGKVNSTCSTSGARRVTRVMKTDWTDLEYDKQNISVVTYNTYILQWLTKLWCRQNKKEITRVNKR